MQAVILFSHGSTLCGAGENLKHLTQRLESEGMAPIVEVGFLNYSEPSFEAAFEKCVARGATQITIAPYFLVAGYFVKVSLPPKIAAMSQQFPEVGVVVADALKDHEKLAPALLACAERAQGADRWRDAWQQAPLYCQDNSQCPLHSTPACPHVVLQGPAGTVEATEPTEPASGFVMPAPVALLVLVHGSPRPESNRDMFAVVEAARATGGFPIVQVGFMECNEPDIPSAIAACVQQGAATVLAVPYFLHTGTHVADDLPGLLEAAQETYPDTHFYMGDYIGHEPLLGQVIADRVAQMR